MRFIMIMFPSGCENAKPGTVPGLKAMKTMRIYRRIAGIHNNSMKVFCTTMIAAAALALSLSLPVAFAQDQSNAMKPAASAKKPRPLLPLRVPCLPRQSPAPKWKSWSRRSLATGPSRSISK